MADESMLTPAAAKLLAEFRRITILAEQDGADMGDRFHAVARIFGDHLSLIAEPKDAAAWMKREARRIEALARAQHSETEQ
ncbi:hypothetical protein A9995_00735 [Erythrobacter sp. QSSC1-22B]|uniref:hypothetical protein n=1 Tax=Erythrobacter sp. QSSC1-22B TaxID=1860125 RepID=UPI0008059820|nr:hypothetical protein [Erythrobacter sp. QSSC1-22B]OBX20291.1 hypothetical protein A9995_00735 [Erythrobacter sp. QSSC1-22B]